MLIELGFLQIARYFDITDKPNQRSLHKKVTIRGGGVIFFIATFFFFILNNFSYPFFFLGISLASIISMIDDIRDLPNNYRIPFHFLAVLLIIFELSLYHLPTALLGGFLFLGVGIINAHNFMDGINGMTGMYSLSVLFSLWLTNHEFVAFIENDFFLFVVISVIVFLFFNFRTEAICFTGDVGSVSMGVIILFLITKAVLIYKTPAFFFFLSVYGVDTLLTIFIRLKNKENIFQAHRLHLFQIIVSHKKISHLIVSGIYAFIQLVISYIVIANLHKPVITQYYIWTTIILTLILLYFGIRYRILKIMT